MSLGEVEAVILRYFEALYRSDPILMSEVMHPAAVYATADEETPLIRNLDEYLEVLEARVAPAARDEVRTDEIISVDVVGGNTAMAQVRCSIGERQFTDFLSLIRVEGEWRIIAKVFAIQFKPQESRDALR